MRNVCQQIVLCLWHIKAPFVFMVLQNQGQLNHLTTSQAILGFLTPSQLNHI